MLGVKILIYSSIFLVCSIIGLLKSQKYVYRVEELQEFKNALNQIYLAKYQEALIQVLEASLK